MATEITVLTYNTANDFVTAQDLEALIRTCRAGIVALQELSAANAAALDRGLRSDYRERILFGQHVVGKGLLSRFPVLRHKRFTLPSGRPYISAVLEVAGWEVGVFVAHPPPGDYRRFQTTSPEALLDVQALLERVQPGAPTLLLGDFNCWRGTRPYRALEGAGLIDIFRAVGRGPGWTFPTRHQRINVRLPRLLRLDYVWASGHFAPMSAAVIPGVGSDHRPVLATLELQ